MNRKVVLLAAAAASAFTVPAANAATAKKHVAAKHRAATHKAESSTVRELREAQQQISQMQAQLNMLQAKLEQNSTPTQAQAEAVAQTQVAAQQAQTQAATASAKADQALALAAKTETAQVKTEKAVSLMSWAGNTKISGRMYFDFTHTEQSASGVKTPATGTGFDIKRLYIGIDHQFNKVFAFNVTTDVSNVVGATSNYDYAQPSSFGSPVGRGFFIKKAYFEAKLDPALIIRAGSADLPWIANDENIYGYRHVENTIIDGPYGTSADWGIHVLGKLGKYFDYQVSAINGAGYRNIKINKVVDFEGRVGVNVDGFFADVGGYVGKRGNALQGVNTYHTARRFDAMAGYKNDLFTIGGEYFYAKDWNNVTTIAEDSSNGFTTFGNVNFTKKWSVFGEYQWVEPNRMTNAAFRQHYFNVGLQFEPVKIVDIALVYKRDVVNNGDYATNNGFYGPSFTTGIGCGTTITAGCRGTYDEVGLFGQIRF